MVALNDFNEQGSLRDYAFCSVRKEKSIEEKIGKKKRVILIAIALDQNYGSEPGIGWLALKSHILLGNFVTLITTSSVTNNFKFDLTFSQDNLKFISVDSKFLKIIKQFPFIFLLNKAQSIILR